MTNGSRVGGLNSVCTRCNSASTRCVLGPGSADSVWARFLVRRMGSVWTRPQLSRVGLLGQQSRSESVTSSECVTRQSSSCMQSHHLGRSTRSLSSSTIWSAVFTACRLYEYWKALHEHKNTRAIPKNAENKYEQPDCYTQTWPLLWPWP
jgi:hypothetical protein